MSKTHHILTELETNGKLKELVNSGYCPPSVYRNLEIYRFVDARMKTGGKKNAVVLESEVQFKLCRKTIFNILNTFK